VATVIETVDVTEVMVFLYGHAVRYITGDQHPVAC
jgi:hypothetical protein